MKKPSIRLAFDRKHVATTTTTGTVDIIVTYRQKRKFMSTGVRVCSDQWNPAGYVVKHMNGKELNAQINDIVKTIEDYIQRQEMNGEEFTFEGLSAELEARKYKGSFMDYVSERLNERKDISESTRKITRSLIPTLKRFGRINTFNDLTEYNIRRFDDWLHDQGYRQTTVAKYHKFVKTYINDALRREIIEKDPYRNFKVPRGKSRGRKYLTESELRKIEELVITDPAADRARDVFVFQCYTGLAYADLAKFDFRKIEQRAGRYVIRDARCKTGEDFYIVLLSPALAILEKHAFKLPVVSNQKYNSALKYVGISINKHLTSHMGRHKAATLFLNKGMPLDLVAKVMGHSSTKQTSLYAKIVDKTLENAFDDIERQLSR